jgi:hypothetical protein
MADFCTCGAQLPPDALFCHKCGKPQREIAGIEPEPAPQPAPVFSPAPAPEIHPPELPPVSFRNPVAVRIGLLLAVAATVLSFLPFFNWLAAGFFAVFFYRRKTGSLLSIEAGLRMGWITGLMAFVMVLITSLPAALSGQFAAAYEQQMKSFRFEDPATAQQMARFIGTPQGIAMIFAALFVFSTFLCMAGGALGAKLVGGNRPASR